MPLFIAPFGISLVRGCCRRLGGEGRGEEARGRRGDVEHSDSQKPDDEKIFEPLNLKPQ